MSLLQDVLRSHTADSLAIEKRLNNIAITIRSPNGSNIDKDDSDDELVNVVSPTELLFDPIHTSPP